MRGITIKLLVLAALGSSTCLAQMSDGDGDGAVPIAVKNMSDQDAVAIRFARRTVHPPGWDGEQPDPFVLEELDIPVFGAFDAADTYVIQAKGFLLDDSDGDFRRADLELKLVPENASFGTRKNILRSGSHSATWDLTSTVNYAPDRAIATLVDPDFFLGAALASDSAPAQPAAGQMIRPSRVLAERTNGDPNLVLFEVQISYDNANADPLEYHIRPAGAVGEDWPRGVLGRSRGLDTVQDFLPKIDIGTGEDEEGNTPPWVHMGPNGVEFIEFEFRFGDQEEWERFRFAPGMDWDI